jgi:hypothetical protein
MSFANFVAYRNCWKKQCLPDLLQLVLSGTVLELKHNKMYYLIAVKVGRLLHDVSCRLIASKIVHFLAITIFHYDCCAILPGFSARQM